MRATCPAHVLLVLITLIMLGEAHKLWNSSSCSLFQPPATNTLLGPFSSAPCSQTPSNCVLFFFGVRDEVSPHTKQPSFHILHKYCFITMVGLSVLVILLKWHERLVDINTVCFGRVGD
jgi:hypothetical protein